MAATDIVTVADAKAQLNIPLSDTSHDAELAGFVSAATGVVERYAGAVINRTVTETFDGGRRSVLLAYLPVVSVTSVTEAGTAVDPAGYTVASASGVLTRSSAGTATRWGSGLSSVAVTYVAGQAATTAEVPGNIRLAALIIIQHMWETQRPAAEGPFAGRGDDFDPRYTYSIPRRALELLGEPTPSIA